MNAKPAEPAKPTATRHLLAYVALLALAGLSIVVARVAPWPSLDLAISLAIALGKALLVLWIFMHLSAEPLQTRLVLGVSAVLVLTLVVLASADVATRQTTARAPVPTARETFYRR
jgi:caa(3)-type oxidase subunit IV